MIGMGLLVGGRVGGVFVSPITLVTRNLEDTGAVNPKFRHMLVVVLLLLGGW